MKLACLKLTIKIAFSSYSIPFTIYDINLAKSALLNSSHLSGLGAFGHEGGSACNPAEMGDLANGKTVVREI